MPIQSSNVVVWWSSRWSSTIAHNEGCGAHEHRLSYWAEGIVTVGMAYPGS